MAEALFGGSRFVGQSGGVRASRAGQGRTVAPSMKTSPLSRQQWVFRGHFSFRIIFTPGEMWRLPGDIISPLPPS